MTQYNAMIPKFLFQTAIPINKPASLLSWISMKLQQL